MEPELAAVSVPTIPLFADIWREVAESAYLMALCDEVATGDHGRDWVVQDGLLHQGWVFVLPSSYVLKDVLQLAHTGAHEGIQKML
jgi:hypothetical protein